MDFLNRLSIRSRMVLAFLTMLILFVLFALYSIDKMQKLGALTVTLYKHPLKVSNAALSAASGIVRMHRSMKDVSMARSRSERTRAVNMVRAEEKRVYQNLALVKREILGREGRRLVMAATRAFARWKPIRLEVEQLVARGEREAAALITRKKGADYVLRLERKMGELTAYARAKADGFVRRAHSIREQTVQNTIGFISAVALMAFLIAFLIVRSILSGVSSLNSTMSEIATTGKLVESELIGKNEISAMAGNFNKLVEKLRGQLWLKEGQNELSRRLSGALSSQELNNSALNFISIYVGACAGALYLSDGHRPFCELKAAFGLSKGKPGAGGFSLGEGLVGRVARDRKPACLPAIGPEEAPEICGDLGAAPKSLCATPLLHEDTLYGVLEVSSFEALSGVKQEFLEQAGHLLALSLFSAAQKQRIEELLAAAKEYNEELRDKADELRLQSKELKEQNLEMELQRKQVEEANRLKSEFLSNMSHELRTPLNSVLTLSKILSMEMEGQLSAEQSEYLEVIHRSGKNLLELINDILDLSKIESGNMPLRPNWVKVNTLVAAILEQLKPIADHKGLSIVNELPEDLPRIETDKPRLQRILQNLLNNAVKFTEQGSVTLQTGWDDEYLSIEIMDTGIGIAEEELSCIFDEFRQLDGSISRNYEGTGLGLAIARKSANLIHGRLSVESEPGRGSKFTLVLPEKWMGPEERGEFAVHNSPEKDFPGQNAASPPSAATILLVEDNRDNLLTIKAILKDKYRIIEAVDGPEGLKAAYVTVPDLILLDISLPKIDGLTLAGMLKADPRVRHIPIIAVTAHAMVYDRERILEAGCDDYISKPVDGGLLLERMDHWLKDAGRGADRPAQRIEG